MDWSYFIYFAAPALLCWIGGAWLAYRPTFSKGAVARTVFGLVIFSAFIVGMWISLERPPLRTMGETRIWYSFFLPVAFLARSASFLANLFVLASDSAQAAITELDEIFISLFGLRAF